jgi:hypothetical protein
MLPVVIIEQLLYEALENCIMKFHNLYVSPDNFRVINSRYVRRVGAYSIYMKKKQEMHVALLESLKERHYLG